MNRSQLLETVKFSQAGLETTCRSDEGMARVAGHVNRAYGSFKKACPNPFQLSAFAATKVYAVENAIENLRMALDAAHTQLQDDTEYYRARINGAHAALNVIDNPNE